jgi:asparagine synthase (glutamine-hydrolysing)
LAQTLKLNSFKIYPSVNDVIKNYELMIYAMDTPQHSTLMSYIFTYKLVKNHGVTVTLDGQGADELQAGYIPYFRYYFSNMKINQIPEHISGNVNKMEGSTKEILTGILFSVFNNSYAKEIIEKILIEKKYQNPFKNLNEQLFLDFNNNLQTLLHYGDRGSMINSIEARFPMLDYRNVEFWMNLPLSYKIHDGWTKYIARLAFNKKLPDEIVWRKDKKGWELPQKEWIKNGLGEKIIFEIENSSFLKELGIKFDRKYLIRDVKNHKYWKLPIKLYNLSLWYKIFFIEGVKKYAKICDNISS